MQRADDTEDKIRVRLATYNEQTKPLTDYYDKTARLHRVDGTQDQETIHREIKNILMSS
jgi:adenylate kinase